MYGTLDEEIYMEEPECFRSSQNGATVCKLNKSLYGLKQSARQWNRKFQEALLSLGLQATHADPCLYTNKANDLFFALYVDDGILAAKTEKTLVKAISLLVSRFKVTMGELGSFVGIQVERLANGNLKLHQEAYAKRILERFNMRHCKSISTPVDAGIKLDDQRSATGQQGEESFPYREAVGAIMFLTVCTRPDLAFAVSMLSQFLETAGPAHWTAVKRVMRYISGTPKHGITFGGGTPELAAFSDSDYANDEVSRKSRTSILFTMNGGAVSWLSQKQSLIATSTCEAEYGAAFSAAKHAVWIRRLLQDMGNRLTGPTKLSIDNTGAIKVIANPFGQHKRSKHWDIQCKFTHEKVKEGVIETAFIPSHLNPADILTKALTPGRFIDNVAQLNMTD